MKEETKRKIGIASRRNWQNSEYRNKIINNIRINPNYGMKGKHHSDATKEKIRLKKLINPQRYWKGKILSDATRKKLSESHKGKHHSDEQKQKIGNSHKGKYRSSETKNKISESTKKYYECHPERKTIGENHPMFGMHHTDEAKKKIKEKRLHQVFPFKDTSIEISLQNALTKNGISFEKHKSIMGQPDIFIEPNICVFIDGCYWHGCEKCYDKNKMNNMQRARIVKDKIIMCNLINEGYIVIRFWEHDIKKDIEGTVMKIKKEVKEAVTTTKAEYLFVDFDSFSDGGNREISSSPP